MALILKPLMWVRACFKFHNNTHLSDHLFIKENNIGYKFKILF